MDADVIIVGFRCAGASLAYALYRSGLKVIVIEGAEFFSDQPMSTHAIQPYGMMMFDKLGLGDLVRGLAPKNNSLRFEVEDNYMQIDLEGTGLDSRSPRRSKLDPALQKAALDIGVDAREKTRVTGLLWEHDQVVGVKVKSAIQEYELRAPWVIGADGRNSTVAKLVSAPAYLESVNESALYWSYFEETPIFESDPRYNWDACIRVEGKNASAVFKTDSNLLLIAGGTSKEVVKTWSRNSEESLMNHLRSSSFTAPLLEGSKMLSKPMGLLSAHYFMKQAVGPGWALIGDAGMHLDPTPGLGISDAIRDAVKMSEALIDGSEKAMQLFWRQRDVDSLGLYYFAKDMGSEGYNNAFTKMLYKYFSLDPEMKARSLMMVKRDIYPHDMILPSKLLTWLAKESLAGNFSPWSSMGRIFKMGGEIMKGQKTLEKALAKTQAGDLDSTVPFL